MSHSSDDKILVSQVKDELSLFGIDGFVAHRDIEPAKEWMSEIEAALASCDALAAFLSPKFKDSKWCDQEVGCVLSRKRVIVPVRLGIDPYGFMGRYQGMQGSHLTAECLAQQVYDILRSNPKTTDAIARAYEQKRDDAIVGRFESSPSYNAARRNAKRLEEVQRWTPELLGRIERAVSDNVEVANAYGVRAAVNRILEQYRPVVAALTTGAGDALPF